MMDYMPSDRELEALKVLWRNGRATVREICDAIAESGDELAYTTVLSLLQVMEQKGLVGHERVGKAYVYIPKLQRTATYRNLATSFLTKVFDGAVDEYLVHALDSRGMTSKDFDKLETLIADAKKAASRRKHKG
jgi:BlaI family transcriptional regulator, penicillinase repressor